jgi:hypothetical protein
VAGTSLVRPSARGAFWGRLLIAHLLCYPLLFALSLALISLTIIRYEQALLEAGAGSGAGSGLQRWLVREVGLSLADAARFEIILKPLGLALALLFVVLHLISVPWALAAAREARARGTSEAELAQRRLRRAQRWWLGSSLGLTGLLVLGGLAGWVWILTR